MDFIYDNSGKPYALKYDGTTYYYVLNLQGDVISIITHWGESYGSYTYDAWGNVLSVSGDIANLNPIRYRGYYYDSETRLYYLQSRYYDPQVKRFVNADGFASTGQGFIGQNMFVYCLNNPVCYADENGELSWQQVLYVGVTTALIGFAILTALPTGGGSLLLAGAGGGAMAASAATAAATVSAKVAIVGGTAAAAASIMYSSYSKPPTSRNQMQKQVENGQAPKEVDRVDGVHTNLKPPNDQPHVHFKNGTAINFDGSMHHGSIKDLKITNQIAKWLLNNGWSIPTIK